AMTDAGHAPAFTNCGASPSVTFSGAGGNTVVNGSNLAVTAGGTCTVTFFVEFPNPTSVSRVDTNQLVNSNVTFTSTSGPVSPASTVSANVTELPTISVTNYVASNSGLKNQPLTVQATINDPSGTPDTGGVAVINLTAGKVSLSSTPNFTFSAGCPAGLNASSITIGAASESFTVNIGSINASCTIGYDVIDEGGALGTFVPANPTYSGALTGGTPVASTGQNNVTFATTTINVTKAFNPNQIQAGGTSTADIALSVQQAGTLPTTQANGVGFADALPANVNFSPTPNVTFGAGCQAVGQPAPGFVIAGTTITFSNISLTTVGASQTVCHVQFDVTSNVVGAPLNQIGAGAITSTSGVTNTQVAKASLTVNAGLGVSKTFVNPSFAIGGTDYVRFLITNSASSSPLTSGTLVDAMPSSLALASTTLGPAQGGDPVLCGGSVAGPVGSGTINLSGLTVPASGGPGSPGQCVVYVLVGASGTAAPGSATNTVPVGALNAGGFSNQTSSSANVTLTPPPAPTLAKAFSPTSIAPNGTSTLTITVSNTAAGAAPLSALALTDNLPAGVVIATTPNAATTCGAGTVTATAGSSSVALSGGTIAAAATCTITVSVTAATAGTYTNTIPASAITDTQGATNASPATASLQVAPSIALAKAFSPTSIPSGGTSTLTITIPNTAAGAVALDTMALTDNLPSGVTIATTPNAATTCGAGTATATAGGTSVALSGGTLAANATCTITVSVTAATAGTYTNTIPASSLTDTQGSTNPNPATAALTVVPTVAITKAFAPSTITPLGPSTLTITIPNTSAGAVALSGMSLLDSLPAGITIAATPNAFSNCGPGSVGATPGGSSVTLGGGALAANASCIISVSVTGTAPATYTNTIPAGDLNDTQGVTNPNPASAQLIINPTVTLAKAFSPTAIAPNGTSTLTITIPNTSAGAVALSGMTLTDNLPPGITVATTPNAATTCGAGTATATAGGTSVALSGGTLAANATCTITVSVTGTTPATYTNTIPANALNDTQGVQNPSPASAQLVINPTVTLGKAFSPTSIPSGGTSTLTITIPNTSAGAVALSGMTLTDNLPSGITVAATPNAATTCPSGTATATAGGTSVALSGATLAANATCTVTVSVTGTVANSYTNTIPANALNDTQGVSNPTPATAPLTITPVPLTIAKAFSPTSILAGGTSTLTITIPNTAGGAVALSGMA
ncbi:MAG: hypothetical protein JO164_02710, partial [Candidatus Eremiobacteraeota bacterium]|nr:hypothetical protein [Candidatus Eremiobacteraeota bacterium]